MYSFNNDRDLLKFCTPIVAASQSKSQATISWFPAGSIRSEERLSFHKMLPPIAADHTVILRLPSGVFKLITINPKAAACSLGKFGSFNANDLIGHPYGLAYEIQTDKALKILTTDTLRIIEDEETGDNEFIIDDQETNQSLSHEQIRAMRDAGDRDKLIMQLKQNNKSFELKTEFSKEKYMARKMAKFAPRFTVIPPTIFDVINYLVDKDADRIQHVNPESMAYMLNTADIRPGCNYLVVDDVSGLLVSAVLERGGNVTMIHDLEHPNLDVVKYFPQFSLDAILQEGRIKTITWERVLDPEASYTEIDEYLKTKLQAKSAREHERINKRKNLRQSIEEFHASCFDGCLVMSAYTATSIVPPILSSIARSRKLVIYSAYREPLLSLRHENTPELLAPSIVEVRAREYQVLPGRTRPVMTKRGEWGYVYHAIKVERLAGITAVGKNQQAQEKRNAAANAAKKAAAISLGSVNQILNRTESTDDAELPEHEASEEVENCEGEILKGRRATEQLDGSPSKRQRLAE